MSDISKVIADTAKAKSQPSAVSSSKRSLSMNFALAALAGVALAGCAAHQPAAGINVAPSSYQTRHPIVVDASPTNLDLPAGDQKTHFTPGMKSAIVGFAGDYRRSGGKGIDVLVPAGSSNEAFASHIAGHAREALSEAGIPSSHIRTRSYKAVSAEHPGHVRLTFTAIKARVASECGVWPTDIGSGFENENYENFGCASQQNLAAIIADPNDLISPRGPGEINPERTDVVISDFESNATPAATAVSTTSF
ncbi:MAG: CpaD family pilus assembly protein [Hyphomicrobiales bacterium]